MAEATMEEVINVEGALQPCGICGRTFLPAPLAKHMRVCERNATRKRKVFDSLKQRVEGTELAQFHQRTYLKRQHTSNTTPEANKQSSKWREKHLELVNTIREARGLPIEMPSSPRRTPSSSAAGSERCPSCDRQFGPRAYDRHVEWCKQQRSRAQRSPAEMLLAKERLEARTKYRVPPPKSKRTLIREKYSPTLGNRTESVNSIKSVSCSNLERSPSIRKQRSVLITKTEREPIKFEHHGDAIAEYEENIPKQQIKEKCVPKERKIPVIEGMKSSPSHLPRLLPRSKINTTEINNSVEGITVSHMKIGPGDIKEPRRMVTWKDTVRNATLPNVGSLNSTLLRKSTGSNKKAVENTSVKIADNEIKSLKFKNESKGIVTSKKSLSEANKIKKSNSSKKCSKINLTIDADYCSLDSSRSITEAKDEISLKHSNKNISFKSLNELKDNWENNDGNLNIQNISKNSPHYLKSKLQEKNQNRQVANVESENIMTTKLKVPFSISKYRKTKVGPEKKLRTSEKNFHLESSCPTITEYDEEELNTENDSFEINISESAAVSDHVNKIDMDEYVSTTPKIKSPKKLSISSTSPSPAYDINEVCSTSPNSLEIVNESPTAKIATVCESSTHFENQQNDSITANNSLLLEDLGNSSTQMKMYDSYKWKNSDILSTVQDICSKEKHCLNNEFYSNSEQLKNSNKYNQIDTNIKGYENVKDDNMKINCDFHDTFALGRKQNELVFFSFNNKITESVVQPEGRSLEESGKDDWEQNVTKQNLQVSYDLTKKAESNVKKIINTGLGSIRGQKSLGRNVKRQRYETAAFGKAYEISKRDKLEADSSFQGTTILSPNENNLSLSGNNNIRTTETIEDKDVQNYSMNKIHEDITIKTQPDDNIVLPTVGKTIPFMLKFENQNANIRNIDVRNMCAESSNSEQGKCIVDAIDDTYAISNKKKILEFDDSVRNTVDYNQLNPKITNMVSYDDTSSSAILDYNSTVISDKPMLPSPSVAKINILKSKTNLFAKSSSNEDTFGSKSNFDFDSLESCNKNRVSNNTIMNEDNETICGCPQICSKHNMEENYNSIDNISNTDLSVLHKPSYEVEEIESLECINVDIWNEALSMARMERSVRKCCSAVCLSPHKSQENNFATYTELDLTKFSNDATLQGCIIHFQYQTDDVIIEGEHIELQSGEVDDWTSDRILEIAGDQFIASFKGDKDGLTSSKSSIISDDCIPIKRRKLCDNGDFITSTSSSSECSSIGSTLNKIIFEHNLSKNLQKIKSRKMKFEHELGGGEVVTEYERFDNSQKQLFENNVKLCNNEEILQDTKHDLVNKYTNNENYTESLALSICSDSYYAKESEHDLIKNVEEEKAVNSPVGTQLMENKNNCNFETNYNRPTFAASSSVFDNISPRLLDIIASITSEDDCQAKDQDCKKEDMFVISKQHCKKLLELDPHVLDFPFKVKLPQIKLKNVKFSSNTQKMISDDAECTKLTLPPIKLKSDCTSKIPVARSSLDQGSNSPVCPKEPVSLPTFPKLIPQSDKQSDYNPFVTAERQLMELLECDGFSPYFRNKSPLTQHLQRPHTTTNTTSKLTDIHKNNKVVKSAENARKSNIKTGPISKRSSVIDPPMDFQDMNVLSDDFELIERLINQNYADGYDVNDLNDINFDSISNKITKSLFLHSDANENNNSGFITKERKYSDDMSSIDPRLINENDNLSIPENLKIDDNSSNSSNDNVTSLISNLHKENHESKRAPKITTTEKINRSLDQHNSLAIKKSKQISNDKRSIKPLKQATKGTHKSNASLTSSYGSTRNNLSTDKKRNLSTLKRSVSLVDPVKPKNLKNKQDVENYFDEQDRKNAIKAERASPEQQILKSQKNDNNSNIFNTPAAEELFSVDDEMYEEYKKYEELYLLEKQQHIQNEKKPEEFVSSGTLTPNEGSNNVPTNVKVSADSAYSSLNRKTPKIRARSTKLAPLDCQGSQSSPLGSPTSSGSETSPTFPKRSAVSQRMSKFCHECGNKYPINTAKFCVECGVRRLVL